MYRVTQDTKLNNALRYICKKNKVGSAIIVDGPAFHFVVCNLTEEKYSVSLPGSTRC